MINSPGELKQIICAVALLITTCPVTIHASLTINMTGGVVDATQSFDNLISLSGNDIDGRIIILTAESGFGLNPLAFNPYSLGATVSPRFYSGGGDLLHFTLSIDGDVIPINSIGGPLGRPGSEFEVDGTSIELLNAILTQSAMTPVTYSVSFNLYDLTNRTFGSVPDYVLTGMGQGTAEVFYELISDGAGDPDHFLITAVNYSLDSPNSSVPEPSAIVICLLIAVGLGGLHNSLRSPGRG